MICINLLYDSGTISCCTWCVKHCASRSRSRTSAKSAFVCNGQKVIRVITAKCLWRFQTRTCVILYGLWYILSRWFCVVSWVFSLKTIYPFTNYLPVYLEVFSSGESGNILSKFIKIHLMNTFVGLNNARQMKHDIVI